MAKPTDDELIFKRDNNWSDDPGEKEPPKRQTRHTRGATFTFTGDFTEEEIRRWMGPPPRGKSRSRRGVFGDYFNGVFDKAESPMPNGSPRPPVEKMSAAELIVKIESKEQKLHLYDKKELIAILKKIHPDVCKLPEATAATQKVIEWMRR
jgi:hypothetical protein